MSVISLREEKGSVIAKSRPWIGDPPRIIDPSIWDIQSTEIRDTFRKFSRLGLELVVNDKDAELSLSCDLVLDFLRFLQEFELFLDVGHEFDEGVSEQAGVMSITRDDSNFGTHERVFRESSTSSTTRILRPSRPPWLYLVPICEP